MRKIFLVGIGILGVSIVSRGLDSPLAHFPVGYSYPGNHLQMAAVRHDL
jgi:hypothetical protein